MRHYEIMIILDPNLEERAVQPSLDQFLKVVTGGGGKVEKTDIWGKRRLAYQIEKKSEGFYAIGPTQMNPNSHYYLSFDVGFPNAYDKAHGASGSAVMIHGTCSSMGCFAMTDKGISEIYAFVDAAIRHGFQGVRVAHKQVLQPFAVRRARAVVAVSGFARDEAVERFGADPARIHVVHSGPGLSPADPFSAGPQAGHPTAASTPYVLYVGNLAAHKNLPFLIRAFGAPRSTPGWCWSGPGSVPTAWSAPRSWPTTAPPWW